MLNGLVGTASAGLGTGRAGRGLVPLKHASPLPRMCVCTPSFKDTYCGAVEAGGRGRGVHTCVPVTFCGMWGGDKTGGAGSF